MKNLVWVLFVIFSFSSFAQPINEFNIILFPQGYGLKQLNSSGNSSIINDVSNISFMNPASINNFKNYSAGLSYQANTNLKEAWALDLGVNRVYNLYPQSFGAVTKWQGFTFGLGFGQSYNGTEETEPLPVTTIQNPEGTGEFIDVIEENSIQSYSISTAYSFKEILESYLDFSVGLKYSLNRLHQYIDIWDLEINSTGYYSDIMVGLVAAISIDDSRKFTTGFSYKTDNSVKAKIEYKNPPVLYDIDPQDSVLLPANFQDSYLLYTSPSELNFDFAVDAAKDLKLLFTLSTVFWKSDQNNLENQLAYTFSTNYMFNEIVSTSLGIYSTDFKYKNSYFDLNGKLYTVFLTTGLKININQFSIDLALADSHLFSGDYTKQTIGKLSFGINL